MNKKIYSSWKILEYKFETIETIILNKFDIQIWAIYWINWVDIS